MYKAYYGKKHTHTHTNISLILIYVDYRLYLPANMSVTIIV